MNITLVRHERSCDPSIKLNASVVLSSSFSPLSIHDSTTTISVFAKSTVPTMRSVSLLRASSKAFSDTSAARCLSTSATSRLAQPAAAAATGAAKAQLSQIALSRAKDVESNWQGTSMLGGTTKNYIDGKFVESSTSSWLDVNDPSTQALLSRVPLTTKSEFEAAVANAQAAFPAWRETSLLSRQQVMFKLQALLRDHMDDIANAIVLEQGKTFADAKGDVLRGLQVVEVACGITSTLMEERIEVSKDMDTYARREPLGVTAAIAPFNFPAMIPLWSIPMATVTGNTLVLKPSERVPGASMIIAELCERAGMPKGVLNVVNGAVDIVNGIASGKLSAREVAVAFCKRAAIAQQMVSLRSSWDVTYSLLTRLDQLLDGNLLRRGNPPRRRARCRTSIKAGCPITSTTRLANLTEGQPQDSRVRLDSRTCLLCKQAG